MTRTQAWGCRGGGYAAACGENANDGGFCRARRTRHDRKTDPATASNTLSGRPEHFFFLPIDGHPGLTRGRKPPVPDTKRVAGGIKIARGAVDQGISSL